MIRYNKKEEFNVVMSDELNLAYLGKITRATQVKMKKKCHSVLLCQLRVLVLAYPSPILSYLILTHVL